MPFQFIYPSSYIFTLQADDSVPAAADSATAEVHRPADQSSVGNMCNGHSSSATADQLTVN